MEQAITFTGQLALIIVQCLVLLLIVGSLLFALFLPVFNAISRRRVNPAKDCKCAHPNDRCNRVPNKVRNVFHRPASCSVKGSFLSPTLQGQGGGANR